MNRTPSLGVYEKLSYYINKITPHNLVMVGEFSSPSFDMAIYLDTLKKLLEIYPSFKYSIDDTDLDVKFVISKNQLSIPSRIVNLYLKNITLDSVMEEELNKSIDISQAPLARSTLVQVSDTEWVIIFTYHHALGGAVPGFYLLNNFFKIFDSLLSGEQISFIPYIEREPVDLLMPEIVEKEHQPLEQEKKVFKVKNTPISGLSTRILRMHLSKEQTDLFISNCKKHNVTVHSIVTSASIKILQKMIEDELDLHIADIGASTLVNLRRFINGDVQDADLCYLSSSFFDDYEYNGHDDIWDFAKTIKIKVIEGIENKKYFDEYLFLKKLFERTSDPQKILESIAPVKPSVCISSAGNYQFDHFETIKIENCYVTVSTHCYTRNRQRIFVIPQTYNGKLSIVIEYAYPVYTPEEIKKIGSSLLKELNITSSQPLCSF